MVLGGFAVVSGVFWWISWVFDVFSCFFVVLPVFAPGRLGLSGFAPEIKKIKKNNNKSGVALPPGFGRSQKT